MRTRSIKFDDDKIPAWTYDGSEPSYTFTSAIALSSLEDTMIRLSSALQTRLLGHNVFGKQHFMLRKDGTYLVSRKVCFGMDFESHDGPQAELSTWRRPFDLDGLATTLFRTSFKQKSSKKEKQTNDGAGMRRSNSG